MEGTTTRGRPVDPQLQHRFVEAALDLLTTNGYAAVTTAAVAKRAGASTASLYRRWPTKKALVTDIARALSVDALSGVDTGSLEGDLTEFIRRKRLLLDRVGTALLALIAEACHDEELRSVLRHEVVGSTSRYVGSILERAAARGEIPPPAPGTVRVLGHALIGGELLRRALAAPSSRGQEESTIGPEVALVMHALTSPQTTD